MSNPANNNNNNHHPQQQPQYQQQPPPPTSTTTTRSSNNNNNNNNNHLAISLTGATFLALSSLLTRRALISRRNSIIPKGLFHPSNAQPLLTVNGRTEAYQALGLATAHVAGVFTMVGAGLLWAFDVGGMEDLRRRVGRGRGRGTGRGDGDGDEDEVEVEFARWVASFTGRGGIGGEGEDKRRWSAREPEEEERGKDEGYAVEEPQATNGKEKPR